MNLYLVCDSDYVVAPDEATALQMWRDLMKGHVNEARDYPDGIEVVLIDPTRTLLWDSGNGIPERVSVQTLIDECQGVPKCIGGTEV